MLVVLAAAGATLIVTGAQAGEVDAVAKCALKKDRAATISATKRLPLGHEPVTLTADALGNAASCLNGSAVTAPAMQIRGAVAEQLYVSDFREVGVQPRRKPGDFADLDLPDVTDKSTSTLAELPLYRLADCVARNDAESASFYLKAPAGSRMEKERFAKLQPYMAACAHGQRIVAAPGDFRAALAQAAYHTSARYWDGQLSSYRASR